jgi:hypothetical protein
VETVAAGVESTRDVFGDPAPGEKASGDETSLACSQRFKYWELVGIHMADAPDSHGSHVPSRYNTQQEPREAEALTTRYAPFSFFLL